MRRPILAVLLLLLSLPSAQAGIWYYSPGGGSGTWTGGAFTDPAEGPDGCANPAYGFGATDADAGVCLGGANDISLTTGALSARLVNTGLYIGQGVTYDTVSIMPPNAGAGSFNGLISSADLTDNRAWTFPNATGDVAVIAAAGFPVRTGAQAWSTRCLAAGTGVTIAEACGQAGNITVGVDTAVVNTFSSGTGDVPATGAVGTSYAETDALSMYDYPATDTEHWRLTIAAGQTAGRLFQTSATDVLAEITPTDETVLVSNGSTWEKKTLPDCDDTGGNHLNYDTGTNAFSCGTSGGGSSWTFVQKTADQSKTTDTAYAADNTLVFTASATTNYTARWFLYYELGAGGLKVEIDGPASPTLVGCGFLWIATVDSQSGSYKTTYNSGITWASAQSGSVEIDCLIKNGSNAGTVSVRWAQNSSNAAATTVLLGSRLEYRQVQ